MHGNRDITNAVRRDPASIPVIQVLGVILLVCVPGSAAVAADKLNPKQALELLDGALQAVRSFDVKVDITRRYFMKNEVSGTKEDVLAGKITAITLVRRRKRETPLVERYSFRQVFQQGKGRIEYLSGPRGENSLCIVYDEEVEKVWNPRTGSSSIRRPGSFIDGSGLDYLETYRNAEGRLTLLTCFRTRKNGVLKDAGPSDPFVILETNPVPPGGDIDLPSRGFRVAMDPRRGFLPAVIERFEHAEGKAPVARRTSVTAWKDVGGVRVPIQATTQEFDTRSDMGTFGEMNSEVVLTVDAAKSSWNTDIPEETFQLPLPAGTRITDHFREVQYVTGKPDPGKNLQDLAANARDLVPVQMGRPPAASRAWLWWLGGGLAILAGTAASWWYLRRRQLGRST